MTNKVDYIIVGQGIAGTWLAYELLRRGHNIVVYNYETENTSSDKAAGLYNPITGRKMIQTWRADDFFPELEKNYKSLETLLKTKFLHPTPIYRPFKSIEDQNDWQAKLADPAYRPYVREFIDHTLAIENIKDPFGGIILSKTGYVDIPLMITAFRNYLKNKGHYVGEMFRSDKLLIGKNNIKYENWEAQKVIFCEGVPITNYWNDLPFRPVRGEIIDIECDLSSAFIINQGVFIIPKNGYFTVGSTYDHSLLTYEPQKQGIENIVERLKKVFSGNFSIISERAGIRPATHDRKPYVGFHKEFQTLAIFNGFGTKGVSLSPYFAKHFVDVLEGKTEIEEEINVERVF